jgi:hypothetical protein
MTTRETITADTVRAILEAAWPRAGVYPDHDACESLAICARVVRDRRKPVPPPDPAAIKHGRLFAQHAGEMQDRLRTLAKWRRDVLGDAAEIVEPGALARLDGAVTALATAEQAVRDALAAYGDAMPPPRPDLDAAKYVAQRVQQAWQGTPGAAVPVSVNECDPLVLATRAILGAAGRQHSAAAISAVLRGRNDRLRHARGAGGG